MGVPQSIYGFSLPLGATINMDGAGIRIAISAAFAANVVGVPLDVVTMLEIVLIGTLASIGTAGVPGAGIVMIATVFAQVGHHSRHVLEFANTPTGVLPVIRGRQRLWFRGRVSLPRLMASEF